MHHDGFSFHFSSDQCFFLKEIFSGAKVAISSIGRCKKKVATIFRNEYSNLDINQIQEGRIFNHPSIFLATY
jgi:hypothetical protein